jgi:prepilin-type N-terminal cleavage/methylation domain-containing protein
MKDKAKAGFTLTELLVVIAVIGLLGSIIFAITRGAGEQGRIAKGLYFSQHLHNSLGSYAAGIWNFDEGSGATANDTSGWGNNGTLVNIPTWRCVSTDAGYTPSGQGCSLEFNGSSQYVNAGNNTSLNIISEITVEAWIYFVEQIGSNPSIVTKARNGCVNADWSYMSFAIGTQNSSSKIRYGTNGTSFYSNTTLAFDNWYHLVLVAQNGQNHLYVNGSLDSTNSRDFTQSSSEQDLVIGTRKCDGTVPAGYHYTGLIDEVRIYAISLTSSQIQSRYYAGLDKLLVKGQITQEEYKERVKNV